MTEARGAALPSCAGRQELKIVAEKKSHAGEGDFIPIEVVFMGEGHGVNLYWVRELAGCACAFEEALGIFIL